MIYQDWLRSWRVLLILAAANLAVLGPYATYGLFITGTRGIPVAGLMMVLVGAVAIFVVAVVAAFLLKAGIAKNAVSTALILLGLLALLQEPVRPEMTATGIVGTSFVIIALIAGALGLYEEDFAP